MKRLFFILLFTLSSCAGTYYTVQTSSYSNKKCHVHKHYHYSCNYKYYYKPLHKPIHKPIHRKYIRKHRK